MKIIYLFLFIGIIIGYSCNENTTEIIPADNSIVPFKLNNYWEYSHFIYDSNGDIISSISVLKKVAKDTFFLNQRFFQYAEDFIYYTTKNNGLWMYEVIDDSVKSGIYLKYPCNIGDSYTFIYGRPLNNVTVVSLNENVTVEAGSFTCIQYLFNSNYSSYYVYIYVAPGIGIIKSEGYRDSADSSYYKSWEEYLLGYKLN